METRKKQIWKVKFADHSNYRQTSRIANTPSLNKIKDTSADFKKVNISHLLRLIIVVKKINFTQRLGNIAFIGLYLYVYISNDFLIRVINANKFIKSSFN